MQRQDFHFELPDRLIAQYPTSERTASRLLYLDAAADIADLTFADFPQLVRPGDLLVLNNTRVIPARLFGRKSSGGRVEVLIERMLDENRVLAQVRASKSPRPGAVVLLDGGVEVEVIGRADDLYELRFISARPVLEILQEFGHMPLPPYIEREDAGLDRERYQTVYAERPGAVAAPTAGLHFDERMLQRLREMDVGLAYVTLHVGAGTFQPVRTERIEDHRMHTEYVEVGEDVCRMIEQTRERGGRVVAVGTTVVRCLESAVRDGDLKPFYGETSIFIYPGYRFRVVDALLTNFHLPESTLLMLVCAFAGHARVMAAYRHAVDQGYRFFSYGDAMFLNRSPDAGLQASP